MNSKIGQSLGLLSLNSFKEIGIKPSLSKILQQNHNIIHPSNSQKMFIPALLSGQDILMRDMTGTGKTFGLILAMLSKRYPLVTQNTTDESDLIYENDNLETSQPVEPTNIILKKYLQSLVIVPTRDLALQITNWIRNLSPHVLPADMSHNVQCVISGVDYEQQKSQLLSHPPRIIIGTPVRTLELLENYAIDTTRLQLLIIDEADKIIDASSSKFTHPKCKKKHIHIMPGELLIEKIISGRKLITSENLKKSSPDPAKITKLQVVVCSATLNHDTKRYFKKKEWIQPDAVILDKRSDTSAPKSLIHKSLVIKNDLVVPLTYTPTESKVENNTRENTKQELTLLDDDDIILEAIVKITKEENILSGIIFAHSNVSMRKLVSRLQKLGLNAGRLMDVTDYNSQTLNSQSSVELPRWVCLTEHEARGLDLPSATHVFILGVPSSPASYLHMAGRAGRAGRKGTAITMLGGSIYKERFIKMMKLLNIALTN